MSTSDDRNRHGDGKYAEETKVRPANTSLSEVTTSRTITIPGTIEPRTRSTPFVFRGSLDENTYKGIIAAVEGDSLERDEAISGLLPGLSREQVVRFGTDVDYWHRTVGEFSQESRNIITRGMQTSLHNDRLALMREINPDYAPTAPLPENSLAPGEPRFDEYGCQYDPERSMHEVADAIAGDLIKARDTGYLPHDIAIVIRKHPDTDPPSANIEVVHHSRAEDLYARDNPAEYERHLCHGEILERVDVIREQYLGIHRLGSWRNPHYSVPGRLEMTQSAS